MQVLVIEDERRLAALLQRGLTEDGHHPTVLHDGLQGLDRARSLSFDLILLDIMVPSLNGLEAARRLRSEGNQTPIFMLTARDSNDDICRGLDLGADDYLTKPFSFDVFLARVELRCL